MHIGYAAIQIIIPKILMPLCAQCITNINSKQACILFYVYDIILG